VAGEGKLRHKRRGAIRRGDRGKNLVFFDDMPDFFLSQRNEEFQLTNQSEASMRLGRLRPEDGKSWSLLCSDLSVQEPRCGEDSRCRTA
jgi:hypothetical protein